jgi:hypothetical protein
VLASAPVNREVSILEPVALLPVGGVVLGVVLKWAFDALTDRGKRRRENQFRGWDTRREAYALLRHRAAWSSPREVDTGAMRPWSMVAG